MTTRHTTIGGRLRSFRKHKQLTGDELGGIFGVGKARVSGIENNKWGATLESCLKLWAAFPDLNLDWLLTGRGEMLYVEEQDRLALLQAEQEKLQMEKERLQEEKGRLQAVKDQLEAARSKVEGLEELLIRHGIRVNCKGGSR